MDDPQHVVYYGVPRCTYVVTLKEGDMFGDLGLLLEKPRAASIICKEDSELATLTAADYKNILQVANTIKINNK